MTATLQYVESSCSIDNTANMKATLQSVKSSCSIAIIVWKFSDYAWPMPVQCVCPCLTQIKLRRQTSLHSSIWKLALWHLPNLYLYLFYLYNYLYRLTRTHLSPRVVKPPVGFPPPRDVWIKNYAAYSPASTSSLLPSSAATSRRPHPRTSSTLSPLPLSALPLQRLASLSRALTMALQR